jgi:hypothetical protein
MKKTLSIFDFDDTLVFSGAAVHITHANGTLESLESHEFATYKEQPGDQFDYSEFDIYPPGGQIIDKTFNRMLETIASSGPENVIVLSARSNPQPMKQFLSDHGLSTSIDIIGVGSSNPADKSRYINKKLAGGEWTHVEIFEDSLANINAIGSMLAGTYPDIVYIKNHIQVEGILRKAIHFLLKELLILR